MALFGITGLAGELSADDPATVSNKLTPRLELIKKLSGDWSGKASHGDGQVDSKVTYRVTSAGSAVMETLFCGTDHEMITMYHADGDGLVLTHYCAVGNQPRMKAIPSNDPKKIEFKFLDGTNLDAAKDMHMHELTIEFLDDDHIKSEWVMFVAGKAMNNKAKFDLHRVKPN